MASCRLWLSTTMVAAICMAFSMTARAEQTFRKEAFSIALPDGWVEIPGEVLDAYEREIASLAPAAPRQSYDYGFQEDGAPRWLHYPYILVQIKNEGRIPEGELEKLESVSGQGEIDRRKEDLSPVISRMEAGRMVYDKQAGVVWLRIEADVVDVGPVSGLSGIVPTEKGVVQVNGYALKDDFSRYEEVFESAIASLTPSPELAYRSRWSDGPPPAIGGMDWGRVLERAAAGAVVGGFVALLAALWTRRKKRS